MNYTSESQFETNIKIKISGTNTEINNNNNISNVIKTLRGHSSEVTCLQLSNDESRLFSGCQDKTIQMFCLITGSVLYT